MLRNEPLRVAVYDPSPLNPYGVEVCNVLASLGHLVEWHTAADAEIPEHPTFRARAYLGGSFERNGLSAIFRRLVGPLNFVRSCRKADRHIIL